MIITINGHEVDTDKLSPALQLKAEEMAKAAAEAQQHEAAALGLQAVVTKWSNEILQAATEDEQSD